MASFKALCLAGAASLVVATSAYAADLPLPTPPEMPFIPPQVAVGSGWYLRGDIGAGLSQLSHAQSTFTTPVPDFSQDGLSLKEAATLGVGAGYQVNNWFRADVTGEYRTHARYAAFENYTGSPNCPTGSGYYCLDGYSGSVASAVFLANGYIQLGTYYGATPYLGAGVGASVNMISNLVDYGITNSGAYGQAADRNNTTLAYALMAGFSYDLTPHLKLDFSYRYLDQGRLTSNPIVCNQSSGCPNEVQSYRLTSNDIRLGVRYVFADFLQPPPPLIRKY